MTNPHEEAIPWETIKQRARGAHYRTLTGGLTPEEALNLAGTPLLPSPQPPPASTQPSSGGARGETQPPASAAPPTGLFDTVEAPVLPSTATFVTDTDSSAPSTGLPSFSTPVRSTPPSSSEPTVWSETPLGFTGSGRRLTTDDLKLLPTPVQASLHALGIGRSEPPEAVAEQILQWFVEEEDERAEGRCDDAVIFYCEQMILR